MAPAGSLSLWRTIRRRKFRIAFCGLRFLALAIAYHQTSGPWYESTAQVLVLKKHLETAPISGPNVVERPTEEYLPTHMLIISSPRIVGDAVRNKGLLARDGLRRQSEIPG